MIPERGSCRRQRRPRAAFLPRRNVSNGEAQVALPRRGPAYAAEVLAALGLEPLALESKEGLAIMNGTSFMSASPSWRPRTPMELALLCDL